MPVSPLPPAVAANELSWELPTGGHTLCYHREGVGRPLLLLHSINAAPSAYEMSPFFNSSALDTGRPIYAPDLPGFGRSNREDREYSPEFFAQCIAEMLDEIGANEAGAADVLALSTTAEFAARAALMAPSRIKSLVLVSPTGLSRRRDSASNMGARVHRILRAPLLGAGLFKALRSRASIRYFLNMGFRDKAPEDMVDYAYLTTRQPGASHAPFYFLSGQFFAPDAVGDLYLPLQTRVLVLYDKDPNISFNFLDTVLAEGSDWRAVRIPGTLGLPHFDAPDLTRAALDEFWAE
ncbi:MAG: alpha/beta fold hydrolase [Congregibacter sp.]